VDQHLKSNSACAEGGVSVQNFHQKFIHGCRITVQGDQLPCAHSYYNIQFMDIQYVLFSVLNSTLKRVHQHLISISTHENKVVCSNYNRRHKTRWHRSPDSNNYGM